MKKLKSRDFYMRVFAASVISVVMLIFIILFLFVMLKLHQGGAVPSKDGNIVLSSELLARQPASLNGKWDAFNQTVCQDGADALSLGQTDKQVSFPIGSLIQAQTDASYRIRFQLPSLPDEPLFLAIPNYYNGSMRVFFNGVEQVPQVMQDSWLSIYALQSLYPLSEFEPGLDYQEIVLTGTFSQDSMTLRNRTVLLGTEQNIFMRVFFDSACEVLLFGMALMMLINGFVFMLFRPNHVLISLLTSFDALLIGRLVFSMQYVGTTFKAITPYMELSDQTRASSELFLLMVTGITGCVLSEKLFDPEREVPRWATMLNLPFYTVSAIVFFISPRFFEQYGSYMLFAVYTYTFFGVFWQYLVCRKHTTRQKYYLFQFLKTMYVGTVIFLDIFFWNNYIDFSLLLYLYTIFFIMHIIVRLYDNNRSYESVEILNQDLEKTVAERTLELSQANRVLSEMTIRDPLTNVYNRLYFENQMERILLDPKEPYLCIFDLDLFKRINDTYGHNAGDEMLCLLTKLVQSKLDDSTIFARIGGEEFVLVFENKSRQEVLDAIYTVHKTVEDNAKTNKKYTTASFGVAAYEPGDTEKNLLRKADTALYEAKANGRNRVVLHWEMGEGESSK